MLIDEQIQIFKLRSHEIQYMDEKEYPLALEFYLQFDRRFLCFNISMIYHVFSSLSSSQYVLYENMCISVCKTTFIT